MLLGMLLGSVLLGQTAECRTPLGVPCYTVEIRQTDWSLFKSGITDISRNVTYSIQALRSDGSTVEGYFDEQHRIVNRAVLFRPANQRMGVVVSKREVTLFKADPFYDQNVRRSEPGDRVCVGGISHYGSAPPAFTYVGTDRVAGISVVVYRKAGMPWRWTHEVAMAPSLDCLALRTIRRHIPDLWGDEQGYMGYTEAVSVRLGQPSPELFAMPQGYRTVIPEEPSKMLDFLSKYPQVYLHR